MAEKRLDPRDVAYWREFKRKFRWSGLQPALKILENRPGLESQAAVEVLKPFAAPVEDDFDDSLDSDLFREDISAGRGRVVDDLPGGHERDIARTSPKKLHKAFLAALAAKRAKAGISPYKSVGFGQEAISDRHYQAVQADKELDRRLGYRTGLSDLPEEDFLAERAKQAPGDIGMSAAAIRPNVTHSVRTPASFKSVAESGELLDRNTMEDRGIQYTGEPQFDMPEEKFDKVFAATDPRDAALLDKDDIPLQQVVLRRSKLKFDPAGRRDSLQIKGPVDIKKAGGMLALPSAPYKGGPSSMETLYLDAPHGEPTRLIMPPYYSQNKGTDSYDADEPKRRLESAIGQESARRRIKGDQSMGSGGNMDWVNSSGDRRYPFSAGDDEIVGLSPREGFFDEPTEFDPYVDPEPIKAAAAQKGIRSMDINKWERLRQSAEESSYVKALRQALKRKAPHLLGVAGAALALPAVAHAAEGVSRIAEGDVAYRPPSMGDVAGMMADAPLPAALGAGVVMGGVEAASRKAAQDWPQPDSVEPTPMYGAGKSQTRRDGLLPLGVDDPYELEPVRQGWLENPDALRRKNRRQHLMEAMALSVGGRR